MTREAIKAIGWGTLVTLTVALLIVIGSRNLSHFDAALVGYTFAVLFAAFGVTYRYAMWLQRPPTALYWKRGWQVFLRPKYLARNVVMWLARLTHEFALNHFIARRGASRWGAHMLIMWGCLIAIAITFPLVFGWIHFETLPEDVNWYRAYVFGFPTFAFPIHSVMGFLIFHGLVWSSILVIAGVMLAMRRRMRDHGAAGGLGGFFPPLVLGAVRQATGSFTPGFVLLALFAILCFVVIFKSGSKPDIKTHLISDGAAA